MALTVLRALAWLLLIAVMAATVGPIGVRPVSGIPVDLERFLAFFAIGGLFGLAYPRRTLLVILLVVLSAALFEMAQLLVPARHGELADFAIKAAGGALGTLTGAFLSGRIGLR